MGAQYRTRSVLWSPVRLLPQVFDAFVHDNAPRADLPGPSGSAFLQARNDLVCPYRP